LARDQRADSAVEQSEDLLDELEAHARVPDRQRGRAQEHHRFDVFIGQVLADATSMRAQQVVLQLLDLGIRDAHVGHEPEAGINSVKSATLADLGKKKRVRALDATDCFRRERDFPFPDRDFTDILQRKRVLPQQQCAHLLHMKRAISPSVATLDCFDDSGSAHRAKIGLGLRGIHRMAVAISQVFFEEIERRLVLVVPRKQIDAT
jgi:hypothetical protein